MVRTSLTNPLRIDCVTPPGTAGTIGMTICPGRRGPSQDGGTWERDLGLDLDAVRAWKPDVALALLEEFEYAPLGIPHFRATVLAAGFPWLFLPIRDGGTPSPAFEREWIVSGKRVRDMLARGGRVLIHCRAGLGRTGLVAACLLIDFGLDPEAAILAVRAARPGAIETGAQESYVRRHRPLR